MVAMMLTACKTLTSRTDETSKQTSKKKNPRSIVIGIARARRVYPRLYPLIKLQTALKLVRLPGSCKTFRMQFQVADRKFKALR